MTKIFPRLIGISFVVAAIAGMLFSLFSLVQVWRLKPALSTGLLDGLDVIHATISTTSMGLATVSDTMKTVTGNVEALQSTTTGLAQSIHESQPLMDTLVKLLGQDLPNTITATRTSLDSAVSSSLLIDNVMGSITSLPLLGLDKYAPAVPLHTALGNVSDSLGKITPALNDIETNLITARANLGNIETGVIGMGDNIEQIKGNLDNARQVISQYQQENDILLSQVESFRKGMPALINGLAWFLTVSLVWLFINQAGLLLKGWELLNPSRSSSLPG
jgi:hypothetical protein